MIKKSINLKADRSEGSSLENSSFIERSFANISKISNNSMTFCKNDESTSSTVAIEQFLNPQTRKNINTPKLFSSVTPSSKQNMRLSSNSQKPSLFSSFNNSARQSKQKFQRRDKAPSVKKILIDLRNEPSQSLLESHASLLSSKCTSLAQSMSHLPNTMLSSLKPQQHEITNIKVFSRLRPNTVSTQQLVLAPVFECQLTDHHVKIESSVYTFDKVFSDTCTQEQIFENVALPSIDDLFNGYNATIFAYGQTGSGKTYTMFGEPNNKGIIPRTIEHIFQRAHKENSGQRIRVVASMLQIYKEALSDLFSLQKTDLRIKENSEGIYTEGLTEVEVPNAKTLLGLVDFGEQIRKVSSTRVNQYSSRSHTLIIITVSFLDNSGKVFKKGKLYLVDLAGSEKIRRSGASGQTLEEAKKINLSLSCLGNVINALTTRKKKEHIPYRQSKLTRLLQDSLSGNCKTSIIVNFSTHISSLEETLGALKFAERAKKIKNHVKAYTPRGEYQQHESIDKLYSIINKLSAELESTKTELMKYKSKNNSQNLSNTSLGNASQRSDTPSIMSAVSQQNSETTTHNHKDQNDLMLDDQSEAPSARLAIPSERANVEANIRNYKSKCRSKPLKLQINLQELSSVSSDSRMNSSLNSPSLSMLSRDGRECPGEPSLNFSIRNQEWLVDSDRGSLNGNQKIAPECFNPFKKQ